MGFNRNCRDTKKRGQKIDEICAKGEIYIATLQREFDITFSLARDTLLVLLDAGSVKEADGKIQILNKGLFKKSLSNIITLLKVNFAIQDLHEQIRTFGEKNNI